MDANKAEMLRVIEYQIGGTCDSCAYFHGKPNQMFGTCTAYTYDHLKHSDEKRQLSVSRQGGCQGWEQSEVSKALHEHFKF